MPLEEMHRSDSADTKGIIEGLADGIDPRTDELLSPGFPPEFTSVIRTPNVALVSLSAEVNRRECKAPGGDGNASNG